MTRTVNITFNSDGTGECLYTDVINLREIGTLRVRRATSIEFDETAQCWVVRDNDGIEQFTDPSRQQCLDWEQEHFGKE